MNVSVGHMVASLIGLFCMSSRTLLPGLPNTCPRIIHTNHTQHAARGRLQLGILLADIGLTTHYPIAKWPWDNTIDNIIH